MAARAKMRFGMTISDTQAKAFGGSNALAEIIDELFDLGAGTTPDITEVYGDVLALSAGSLTIDLTALAGETLSGATTLDGLVVHGYYIKTLGSNSMTFSSGAVNGFGLFTATPGTTVGAGGIIQQYEPAGFGTVANGSADTIDVSGTGTETFRIVLIAGAA